MISTDVAYEQVTRRSSISIKEFRRYKVRRLPVILADVMKDWRALGWTWRDLSKRYGNTDITVSRYNDGWYKASDGRQMALREFLDGVLTADWGIVSLLRARFVGAVR